MILSPKQYPEIPTPELLLAAARGEVGIDHRWLREIIGRGPSVIPDFIAFLGHDEEFEFAIESVLLDVARHLNVPETLPFLHEYARLYSYEFDDELIDAFLALGPVSLETLLAICEESNGEAVEASYTLAALGVRDQRIFDLLLKELEVHPFEAAISLARYGDEAARPILEKTLETQTDEHVRSAVQEALKDLGNVPPEKPEPFDIWKDYPEEDTPAFGALPHQQLLACLDSPDPKYRAYAAAAIGLDEYGEDTRDRLLALASTDPDPNVRGAAWEALESAYEDSEIVAAAFQARFADADVPVEERGGLLVGMAHTSREDPSVRRAILKLAQDPAGRAQAVKAMWHSMDKRFDDEVVKYMEDPDVAVRRQAIAALGWLGITSQLGRLQKAMAEEDVRDAALYAYILASPGETSPAHMGRLFRKVEKIAGGLSPEEGLIVKKALDDRLEMNGHEPLFLVEDSQWPEDDHVHGPHCASAPEPLPGASVLPAGKPGRNDPCPCGSGKKYKKCCGK